MNSSSTLTGNWIQINIDGAIQVESGFAVARGVMRD